MNTGTARYAARHGRAIDLRNADAGIKTYGHPQNLPASS